MAKQLFTTVHLTDPKSGQRVALGPQDKLPKWAVDQLTKSWGVDREDLWGNAADDEPVDQAQGLHEGHPLADGGPADNLSDAEKEAADLREAARDLEALDEGSAVQHGVGNASVKRSHPVDEVVAEAEKSPAKRRAEANKHEAD